MERAFENCTELKEVIINDLKLHKEKYVSSLNMSSMFSGCEKLESVSMRRWDVEVKAETTDMFSGCKNLRNVVGGHCVLKKINRYWANSLAHFCAQEVGLLDKDGNEVKFKTTKKLSKKKEEFGSMLNRDYLCTIKGEEGLEFEEME